MHALRSREWHSWKRGIQCHRLEQRCAETGPAASREVLSATDVVYDNLKSFKSCKWKSKSGTLCTFAFRRPSYELGHFWRIHIRTQASRRPQMSSAAIDRLAKAGLNRHKKLKKWPTLRGWLVESREIEPIQKVSEWGGQPRAILSAMTVSIVVLSANSRGGMSLDGCRARLWSTR